MQKKTFIQLHPILMLMNSIVIFFVLGGISIAIRDPLYSFAYTGNTLIDIGKTILSYMGFLLFAWIGITYNHHWITFSENHIYVPCDWRMKGNRLQHKVKVEYEKIIDVSFMRSTKSSKNKPIQEESLNPFYHQYMVLHLKNGRKERIKIDFYSKKQKGKILEELRKRLEYCGNKIDFTSARESLKHLGRYGAKFFMDIADKNKEKNDKDKTDK